MRGDSDDMTVFYGIGAVICLLLMVFMLGIILQNWFVTSIPAIIILALALLGLAVYKHWPVPFLKR